MSDLEPPGGSPFTDILKPWRGFVHSEYDGTNQLDEQLAIVDRAEQAIKAIINEALGDDELYGDIKTTVYEVPKGVKKIEVPRAEFVTRDAFRAEIRAKLGIEENKNHE